MGRRASARRDRIETLRRETPLPLLSVQAESPSATNRAGCHERSLRTSSLESSLILKAHSKGFRIMRTSFRRLLSFAFEPEYSFPDAPRRISPGEVVMMLLLITAEWATFWAITAGSVFALCTLIALIFEVRHLKSSVQSSTYQRIYE